MAKFPSGVDVAVAPHLHTGETLMAATYAESTSATDDVMSMLIGNIGRKAARKTGLSDDALPRLPGLAGTIYRGEVVVAVTDRRLLVFPSNGKRVIGEPTWFEPGAVVLITHSSPVLGSQTIDLRFGDNTSVSLALSSRNHGRHVEKAGRALLSRGGSRR